MPDVWGVMRAIRSSDLPATDRHILMTLVSLADPATAVIPDRFMPSLTELAKYTGLGRSTVARRLLAIEESKWVERDKPSVQDAWSKKERTSYRLCIPVQVSTSPTERLVPEEDQSQSGTSPAERPPLVPLWDSTSPAAGHEVPDPRTSTTTTSSSSAEPRKVPEPRKPKKEEPHREDVERVCNYLAEWIVKNGSKRPTITEKWRVAARLLIDKDERSLEEIRRVTAWSQRDTFWKANILSMPTLREKFDTLRLASERNEQGRRNGHLSNVHVPYLDPEDQSVYDRPL